MTDPSVQVERVNPIGPAALDGLHGLLAAVRAADRPADPVPCPLDVLGAARFPWPGTGHEDHVARCDGEVVGAVRVVLPDDGTADGRLDHLAVHPDWRRRGVGTALLEVARAVAADRPALTVEVPATTEGPQAERFLVAHGGTPSRRFVHLRLDLAEHLDEHRERLAALRAAADGYSLVHWGTVVPGPLLDGAGALSATVSGGSAATGSARVRALERMRAGRQRHAWETGLRHDPSGQLVAVSGLTMTFSVREFALQGLTVVHSEHRGRGLATLVKLANLAHARRWVPGLRFVDTVNDRANHPVVALNTALGFRRLGDVVTWRFRSAR